MAIKILAIESSCDETAAAVVEDGRTVLSNIIHSQAQIHEKYGGVVPEIASRKHIENISGVVDLALQEAGCNFSSLDAIAVTAGPGLVGALLVGVSYAKSLAYAARLPLIAVHHIEGHIAANYLTHPDLEPPYLCLVASGGHSHIVKVTGYNQFRILAKTRDDAAGEAFDKAARVLGLGYPGGPKIDMLSKRGNAAKIQFPRVSFADSMDFSFSGVKTALINFLHKLGQHGITFTEKNPEAQLLDTGFPVDKLSGGGVKVMAQNFALADIAASYQSAVIDILLERCLLLCRRDNMEKLAISGGVAANSYLRARLTALCSENSLKSYCPAPIYCTDNAAMIASAGYYEYQNHNFSDLSLNATPYLLLGKRFQF